MFELLINGGLESICKEAVLAQSKTITKYSWRD